MDLAAEKSLLDASRLRDISEVARAAEWGDFLTSFTTPPSAAVAAQRINDNLRRFFNNYILLFLVSVALVVIANPLFLFFCFALGLSWRYAASTPVVVRSYELTYFDKRVIFGGVSLLTNWLCGASMSLLMGAALGVLGVSAHAILRDNTTTLTLTDQDKAAQVV